MAFKRPPSNYEKYVISFKTTKAIYSKSTEYH